MESRATQDAAETNVAISLHGGNSRRVTITFWFWCHFGSPVQVCLMSRLRERNHRRREQLRHKRSSACPSPLLCRDPSAAPWWTSCGCLWSASVVSSRSRSRPSSLRRRKSSICTRSTTGDSRERKPWRKNTHTQKKIRKGKKKSPLCAGMQWVELGDITSEVSGGFFCVFFFAEGWRGAPLIYVERCFPWKSS